MHTYYCDEIKDEFMQLYSKGFEITGGRQKKTLFGMQVEQTAWSIEIHLDCYIKGFVTEYAEQIRKGIPSRPKKVAITLNVVLKPDDAPEHPDSSKHISIALSWQASVRSCMGKIRYCLCSITAGSVLHISRIFSLGSTSPPSMVAYR
jgi:hypothetical protein